MASHSMDSKDFALLQKIPGNLECIDCGETKPDWGSPKLGILFCFRCSGAHRGLGTHISFVRSVTMDSWTDKQMQQMKIGGNSKCIEFLRKHSVDMSTEVPAKDKYDTPAAELYRQILLARVEGRPEPTELPKVTISAKEIPKSRYQGFGSAPQSRPKLKRDLNRTAITVGTAAVAAGAVAWIIINSIG